MVSYVRETGVSYVNSQKNWYVLYKQSEKVVRLM